MAGEHGNGNEHRHQPHGDHQLAVDPGAQQAWQCSPGQPPGDAAAPGWRLGFLMQACIHKCTALDPDN